MFQFQENCRYGQKYRAINALAAAVAISYFFSKFELTNRIDIKNEHLREECCFHYNDYIFITLIVSFRILLKRLFFLLLFIVHLFLLSFCCWARCVRFCDVVVLLLFLFSAIGTCAMCACACGSVSVYLEMVLQFCFDVGRMWDTGCCRTSILSQVGDLELFFFSAGKIWI